MSKKLYVGNLSYSATEDAVRDLFSQHGEVLSVKIITDPGTGRPRGFCFIEMENAEKAMAELNETSFEGRPLKVNEARERGQGQSGYQRNKRGGGSRYGSRRGGYDNW